MADAPAPPVLNAYWVVPGRLMAGPYPGGYGGPPAGKRAVELLLSAGITLFLDLTEVGELPAYASYLTGRARHTRLAIRDFGTPSEAEMTAILDAIDEAIRAGHVVYLHCFAGLGRTGTVVGCYLARYGLEGGRALTAIEVLRGGTLFPDSASPQTEAQCRMVRFWGSSSTH